MLGAFQIPLNECEELYRKLGSDVFKQNLIVGTVKMGWSHAYYDSQIWEEILKYDMESLSVSWVFGQKLFFSIVARLQGYLYKIKKIRLGKKDTEYIEIVQQRCH